MRGGGKDIAFVMSLFYTASNNNQVPLAATGYRQKSYKFMVFWGRLFRFSFFLLRLLGLSPSYGLAALLAYPHRSPLPTSQFFFGSHSTSIKEMERKKKKEKKRKEEERT